MDFRFRYNRVPPPPERSAFEQQRDADSLRRTRMLALGLSIPLTLLSGPLGGWFIGNWIDQRNETAYWGATLLILGIFGSLALVVRQLTILGR